MIVLRNVVKTYATGKAALADVSLTVPREDFVFLVGPNGAGKSTLLKLLIRAEVATSGIVIVAGHDLRQLPEPRVPGYRQQIGIVFQDIRLFPEKTVFENVAFSLQVSGLPRRRRTRDLVMEALDLVGLGNHARRFPAQISGGEQQRAAIARAIVRSPQLLIADEPTANLPPDASWEIMQLLGEINRRGVTVVVATHDSAVVDRTKRRVVELTEGRVVRDQRYGRFTPHGATNGAPAGAPYGITNGTPPGTPAGVPHGAHQRPAGAGRRIERFSGARCRAGIDALPPAAPQRAERARSHHGTARGRQRPLPGAGRGRPPEPVSGRRIAGALLALSLLLLSPSRADAAGAGALGALQARIGQAQQRLQELTGRRQSQQSVVERLRGRTQGFAVELGRVEEALFATIGRLRQAEADLARVEGELQQLEVEISEKEVAVEARSGVYSTRLRALYKFTRTSPLEQLLAAHDFSDVLRRVTMMQAVTRVDNLLLGQLRAEQLELLRARELLRQKQAEAMALRDEVDQQHATLDLRRAEQATLLEVARRDQGQAEATLTEYDQQARTEQASIATLQSQYQRELDEIERQRQEEQRRQQAAQAAAASATAQARAQSTAQAAESSQAAQSGAGGALRPGSADGDRRRQGGADDARRRRRRRAGRGPPPPARRPLGEPPRRRRRRRPARRPPPPRPRPPGRPRRRAPRPPRSPRPAGRGGPRRRRAAGGIRPTCGSTPLAWPPRPRASTGR